MEETKISVETITSVTDEFDKNKDDECIFIKFSHG